MSIIDPNKRQILLIDDFIRYAKQHLNTVEGTAFCSTNYITSLGVPAPGVCNWKGYFIADKVKPSGESLDDPYWEIAKNVESNFSADSALQSDPFVGAYSAGEQLSEGEYRTLNRPNGTVTINYGNTKQTAFVASNDEARKAAEAYLGKTIDDANWNALVSITYALPVGLLYLKLYLDDSNTVFSIIGLLIIKSDSYKFVVTSIVNSNSKE